MTSVKLNNYCIKNTLNDYFKCAQNDTSTVELATLFVQSFHASSLEHTKVYELKTVTTTARTEEKNQIIKKTLWCYDFSNTES